MSMHFLQDQPSDWVKRFASLVPAGLVLDLACGGGRHARLFASLGHPVLAVDRDITAIAVSGITGISTQVFDLERDQADQDPGWPLQRARYAGIVVTNYLHRPLLQPLRESLAPGGVLIYETFAQGNGEFGKPSNPSFLLAPGELLATFVGQPDYRVIAFEDGYVAVPKPALVQRICVKRQAGVPLPSECAL